MATSKLGSLLGIPGLPVELESLADLTQPAGLTAWTPGEKLEVSGSGSLTLLGQPLSAEGGASVGLALLGPTVKPGPFGLPSCTLRDGFNVAELSMAADFGLASDLPATGGDAKISGRAGAAGQLGYRLLLAVSPTTTRGSALTKVVGQSSLPGSTKLAQLDPGEVHEWSGQLSLDLGLEAKASYGVRDELLFGLFQGVSVPFKVAAGATIEAALGLSLEDRFRLTVGRACQVRDGWTRARLERTSGRRLTFGATFGLGIGFDLGSGLVTLLDEILETSGYRKLVAPLQELREVAGEVVAADWNEIKSKLSDRLGAELADLVDSAIPWREWVANSPEVERLVELSNWVVNHWDKLDDQVASLVERWLGDAGLAGGSPFRAALDRVAELDPASFALEDLFGAELASAFDLVEALTGVDVHELLLAPEAEARELLGKVVSAADRTKTFLDGIPAEVGAALTNAKAASGLEATIDLLRKATSKKAIEDALDGRLTALVEKIAGKALDEISPADLARVRDFARRVQELLAAPDEIEKKIKGALQKLNLDYGLSFAWQVERASQMSAVLDFEVPSGSSHSSLRERALGALGSGHVGDVLRILAKEAEAREPEPDGSLPEVPFVLRDCVFTTSRLRASAVTISLDVVGLGKTLGAVVRAKTLRISESELRITNEGGGTRAATYSGGFVRSEGENKTDSELGVWLEIHEQGRGLDPDRPYDEGAPSGHVALRFSREDDATSERELSGIDHLLRDLGFANRDDDTKPETLQGLAGTGGFAQCLASQIIEPKSATRVAFELRFPLRALDTFVPGDSAAERRDWIRAYMNAACRWYADRLPDGRPSVKPSKENAANVLSRLLALSPDLRDRLARLPEIATFFPWAAQQRFELFLDGVSGPVEIRLAEPTGISFFWTKDPEWILLEPIRRLTKTSLGKVRKLPSLADTGRSPAKYLELIDDFGDCWRGITARTHNWPVPLFAAWLWLARLGSADPAVLRDATGYATLAVRRDLESGWGPQILWRARPEIVTPHSGPTSIFPITE